MMESRWKNSSFYSVWFEVCQLFRRPLIIWWLRNLICAGETVDPSSRPPRKQVLKAKIFMNATAVSWWWSLRIQPYFYKRIQEPW